MKSFTWTLVFAFSLSVSAQATINKYYLPPNVNYIGCLQDSNVRILPVQKFIADVTVEKCLSSCSASNHRYSAVELGRECWCGDTLNANILTFTGTSETQKCNIQCKGNPTQICGGTLTANVYHDLSPKIKKTGLPTTVEYLGCFQDSSQRVLPMWQSVSTLTVANCQAACSAAKHPYSGVQCGYECWCGDTFDLGKTTNYTGSDENSKCNFQCGGDPLQICGGVWTLNVYRDSSIGTTSNVVPPPPNVVSTTGPCTSSTNCGPGRQCSIYGLCEQIPVQSPPNVVSTTGPCTSSTNCGSGRQCSIYGWCEQIPTSSVGLRGAQPIRFGNRIWFGRRIVVGNSALDGKPIITDRVYIPPNVAMKNQGGKVMNTTSFNIYVLYYGQLWNQSQKDVIEFFLSHSGSGTSQPDPWSGIADYHHLENGVHRWAAYPHLPDIKSRYHIPFNGKKELTDDDVANYINSAITSGNLAKDPVGIYLFLGGSEIRQRSSSLNGVSCVDYCGWHNWINGGGGYPPSKEMNFNYFGYVQHPGSESDSCWTQCGNRLNTANSYFGNGEHTSPNKDPPIDQMVDMIFHELAEFVTNANGNAWFDSNTLDEAADLCSEFYGVLNNDQRLWDGCKEGSRKDYFAHVPMLARYNPSQFGAYDGSKPYYYNTEIYNEAFTQKRRFLLSAIYNPVEKYWQTGGPYGNPLGCTTGYRTAYWEDWYC